MCYRKPGPRCSAAAAARLALAKHAVYEHFMQTKVTGLKEDRVMTRLTRARETAQLEFDVTPAGIKILERQAVGYLPGTHPHQKLETARILRAMRLELVQAEDKMEQEDRHARTRKISPRVDYSANRLSKAGQTLTTINAWDADVKALLDESTAWAGHLDADEMDAINWYSADGYAEINGSLSRQDWRGGNQRQDRVVTLLDSAMAKVDASKSVVVYRRHFFYNDAVNDTEDNENEESLYAHLSFEEMQARFPVGGVYEPGFYMSTSLNPGNIATPERSGKGFMVRMEILTHRGAALPAVASMGSSEQEILLPRSGRYRVVSNDQRLNITRSNGQQVEVRVIQLQELA